MGTNYYVRTTGCEDACPHCAESVLRHLGKSSAGWKFLFRADSAWPRHMAYGKWVVALAADINLGGRIEDEYGERVPIADLMQLVEAKQGLRSHLDPRPEEEAVWRSRNDYGLWKSLQASNFECSGYDFCDREFC